MYDTTGTQKNKKFLSCTDFENTKISSFKNSYYKRKTLSQLKYDTLLNKNAHKRYIETMYNNNFFKKFRHNYEFNYNDINNGLYDKYKRYSQGKRNHKKHLGSLEDIAREMVPDMDYEKSRLITFNTECDNLKLEMENNYANLREEMMEEVRELENKIKINLNKQKNEFEKKNNEVKSIKEEFLANKNLLFELKSRVNSLKLRVDGHPQYNIDGRLFKNNNPKNNKINYINKNNKGYK